jgi:type I restriction enzyme S subunit
MNKNNKHKLIPKLRFPEFQNDGEWEEKRLGEVLYEPQKEPVKNPSENELLVVKLHCKGVENTGKYPSVTEKSRPYYIRNKGEILVGRQNFHNGGIGIVEDYNDGRICSNAISSYNVLKDELLFVYYFIARKEYYTRVIHLISGTGQKEINKKVFNNLKIFIPSLPEQQKIASCLSSLDEVITGEQQKLELLKQHKKGLLQNLFPQEGETVPKLRFKEFENSGEWVVKKLGEVCAEIKEKTNGRKFKLLSISSGQGLISQIEKFGKEIAGNSYSNYTVIRKNDFAYNKSSTKSYPEGEIALMEEEEDCAVPNSIFTCFRFKQNLIIPYFAKYLFVKNHHGRYLRTLIAIGARAHGALQISTRDLFSVPIPFPSLPEQQKIAACLSSLDDLISAQTQKIEQLQRHKKGLLQGLFPNINNP